MVLVTALLVGCIQAERTDDKESAISGGTPSVSLQAVSDDLVFSIPYTAKAIVYHVMEYRNGNWCSASEGYTSIGEDQEPFEPCTGTITVTAFQDSFITFRINCSKTETSWEIPAAETEVEDLTRAYAFLDTSRTIPFNESFPVAVFVYGKSTVIEAFTVDAYDTPQELEKYDLIRAVTVTFKDTIET